MTAFGVTAGLMAGTVNAMAPVLTVYILELALTRATMVVVQNLCFLAGKMTQFVMFGLSGNLNEAVLPWAIPMTTTAALGLLAGGRLGKKHR